MSQTVEKPSIVSVTFRNTSNGDAIQTGQSRGESHGVNLKAVWKNGSPHGLGVTFIGADENEFTDVQFDSLIKKASTTLEAMAEKARENLANGMARKFPA